MAGTSSWAKQRGDEMQSENATMDKTRRAFTLTASSPSAGLRIRGTDLLTAPLELIAKAIDLEEWRNRVEFLPL